jgi:glycosyltransferase involved in cell wall biosynthesis
MPDFKKHSFTDVTIEAPLVSIIIPTYNRAHLISETLDSILNQTYLNWECIIVDDGSTDLTKQEVQKYVDLDGRFQFYYRPNDRPKGANACRNYGFELSKGEYICWFDSDDIMFAEHLNKKVLLSDLKNLDFVACSLDFFESSSEGEKLIIYKKTTAIYDEPFKQFLLGNLTLRICSPLWSKKFLISHQLFDEKLFRAQEWELYSRLLFYVKKYQTIEESLVLIRHHDENISSEFQKGDCIKIESDFLARKKIYYLAKKSDVLDDECKVFFSNKIVGLLKLTVTSCSFEQKWKMIKFWFKNEISIKNKNYQKFVFNIFIMNLFLFTNRGILLYKN